jgi:hypothetical protein
VNRGRDFSCCERLGPRALSQDRVAYRTILGTFRVCGTTWIRTMCLAFGAIALLFCFLLRALRGLGSLTRIFSILTICHPNPYFALPCNATQHLDMDVEHRTPLLRRKWDGSDFVRSLAHVMRNIVLRAGLLGWCLELKC